MAYFSNPKQLYQNLLPLAASLLYTAPAVPAQGSPSKVLITEIWLLNLNAGAQTVTIYAVPNGGAPGNSNAIIFTGIPAAGALPTIIKCGTVLEAGAQIWGNCGLANAVVLTLSGMELTPQ